MHLPVVVSRLPFSFLNKEGCDDITLLLRANQIFLFTCARFNLLLSLVLDMTASRFIVRSLNQLSLCTLSPLFSDLAFVSSPDLVHDLTVGQPFSDHNSINLLLSRSSYGDRRSEKLAYSFRKADWEHLRNLLNYTPWHCAFLEDNIDLVWSVWSDLLLSAVDECIPKHQVKRSTNAPWIDCKLIKLCRKKKLLYKRAKKSSKESDWFNYRKFNNQLKKECNSARWRYINNLTEELKSNTSQKPFWSYVKSKRKGSSDLVSLKVNDEFLNDDISIANSMNHYFSSVFTVEDQANIPDFDYVTNQKLCNIYCSPAEIAKMLKNLNIYKSPGPDSISPRILKECSQVLSSPLALLSNTSYSDYTNTRH